MGGRLEAEEAFLGISLGMGGRRDTLKAPLTQQPFNLDMATGRHFGAGELAG